MKKSSKKWVYTIRGLIPCLKVSYSFLFLFLFSKEVSTNDEKLESVASFPDYMTFICGVDSENRTRSLPLNKVKKCTIDRYTSKKHFVRIYLENIPHF